MGASTNCDDDHSDYDDDQYHGFFSKVIYGDVYDCDDDQCDRVITKRAKVMIIPMTRQPSVEYSSEWAK